MKSLSRSLSSAALVALLLAVSPASAQKGGKTTNVDADKINPGTYTGILMNAPAAGDSFTLRIETQSVQANQPRQNRNYRGNRNQNRNTLNSQRRLMQLQQQLQRARNAQDARRIQGQIQREMVNMQRRAAQERQRALQNLVRQQQQAKKNIKVVKNTVNVEMQTSSDVVVRNMQLPFAYDEKGNPKTYTAAEKKELKGDNPRLPGYEASTQDLEPGQLVQVKMVRKGRKAVGNKDLDVGLASKNNQVVQILIIQDAAAEVGGKRRKK